VCEGPRVIAAALDRDVELLECYVGADATGESRSVAERAVARGVATRVLAAGMAERVGDTQHPQPIFAVAPLRRAGLEGLDGADLVLVATRIGDPGNAGTLIRSAAAAGAQVIVLGDGSVDAYNPKVVRASAGACFAVRIVEGCAAVEILTTLRSQGVTSLGAAASGGRPPEAFDFRRPTAFVVGNETEGLDPALGVDGTVTLPMAAGESLNAAMAGTALLFEAARQRRTTAT
jgi:TrmH family RNA methyltransferase